MLLVSHSSYLFCMLFRKWKNQRRIKRDKIFQKKKHSLKKVEVLGSYFETLRGVPGFRLLNFEGSHGETIEKIMKFWQKIRITLELQNYSIILLMWTLLRFSSLGYVLATKFFLYFSSLSCNKIGYIFGLKSSSAIVDVCLVRILLIFTAYKY